MTFYMKIQHILAYLLIFSVRLNAQMVEQPTLPYPFGITLTTPDSIEINSNAVFAAKKPTVVAFWLTTCAPCMMEFAAYAQNFKTWKEQVDFQLVAISIDFPQRFRQFQQFAREKGWPFPVYWDGPRAFKDILPGGLNGLPQVFLFDKNGKLVWQHRKYQPGDEIALFEELKKVNLQ